MGRGNEGVWFEHIEKMSTVGQEVEKKIAGKSTKLLYRKRKRKVLGMKERLKVQLEFITEEKEAVDKQIKVLSHQNRLLKRYVNLRVIICHTMC